MIVLLYSFSITFFLLLTVSKWNWLLWYVFGGKEKEIRFIDEWIANARHIKIYLARNYPFFGSGIYCGDKIFVKMSYSFDETLAIMKHENVHDIQRQRLIQRHGKIGSILWWGWAVCNYIELPFWSHNKLPIEREPEEKENVV